MGFGTAHAPSGATAMTPDLAFNTAVSFTTNTNWQNYSGESTLSYLVQMLGPDDAQLHVGGGWNGCRGGFDSGICATAGILDWNFWTDIVRATVYILLPISMSRLCSFALKESFRICILIRRRLDWRA